MIMLSQEVKNEWEACSGRIMILSTLPTNIAIGIPALLLGPPWFSAFFFIIGWGLVTVILHAAFAAFAWRRSIWPTIANHVGFALFQATIVATTWGILIAFNKANH